MRRELVLMLLLLASAAHAAQAQPPHPDRFRYSLFGTPHKAADCNQPPRSRHKPVKRDVRCAPPLRPELESSLQKKSDVTIAEPQPEANSPVKISAPALVGAYARAKPRSAPPETLNV